MLYGVSRLRQNHVFWIMQIKHSLYLAAFLLATTLFSLPANAQQDTLYSADEHIVFEKTEVEATVDKKLWRQHLETNLGEPAISAMKGGIQPGKYTVNVRFIVEKDGSISNATELNDPQYGLAKAAVKVVQTAPKWTAAQQNGRKVRSYHTQPITYFIQSPKTM